VYLVPSPSSSLTLGDFEAEAAEPTVTAECVSSLAMIAGPGPFKLLLYELCFKLNLEQVQVV
jgi:hypothetical protein